MIFGEEVLGPRRHAKFAHLPTLARTGRKAVAPPPPAPIPTTQGIRPE